MKLFEIFGVVSVDTSGADRSLRDVDSQARNTSNSFEGLKSKLSSVGAQMTSSGAAISALVSGPIIGLGASAINVGKKFEQGMANVRAVSGATEEDFKMLTEKAREMGATTKFSATQASEALGYMGMAGWNATQMVDGLPGVMMLASASGEELAIVSDILTDAITAFGDEASDAARYSDVLAATATSANTNVGMLGETFKYAAPIAGSLGYKLEDVAVAAGLMANAGIKSSQAGTSLRSIMTRMAKPTKESQEAMDILGVSLTDTEGKMLSFEEILVDMRSGFEKLDEAESASVAAMLGGQEAMSGLLAIVNTSDEDFDKLTNSINNSSGAAEEMSDIMSDTLEGKIANMKSALEELSLKIFDSLEPALKTGVEIINKVALAMGDVPEPVLTVITILGVLLAAIGPIILILGMFASSISSIMALGALFPAIMAAMGTAVSIFGTIMAFIFSPVGLIIAGIIAVVAAIMYLYKNWEELKDAIVYWKDVIIEAWDKLKKSAKDKFNAIKDFITKPIKKASDEVKKITDKIRKMFDFKIKFPDIKLPKVLNSGSKESSSSEGKTKFFAKGGYMKKATEFAKKGETSYVGGEVGGEGIVPLEGRHMMPMAEAIADILKMQSEGSSAYEKTEINIDSLVVREEADVRRIAEELEKMRRNKSRWRGSLDV